MHYSKNYIFNKKLKKEDVSSKYIPPSIIEPAQNSDLVNIVDIINIEDDSSKHIPPSIIEPAQNSDLVNIVDIINIDELGAIIFFFILKSDIDAIINMQDKNDVKKYIANYKRVFCLNKQIQHQLVYCTHANNFFPDIFYTVHFDNFNKDAFDRKFPFFLMYYAPKNVNKFLLEYYNYNIQVQVILNFILQNIEHGRNPEKMYGEIEERFSPNAYSITSNAVDHSGLLSSRIFINIILDMYTYFFDPINQYLYKIFFEKYDELDFIKKKLSANKEKSLRIALLHIILYYSCTDNVAGLQFFALLHRHFLCQNVYATGPTDTLNDPLPKDQIKRLLKKAFDDKLVILCKTYNIEYNNIIIKDLRLLFNEISCIDDKYPCIPKSLASQTLLSTLLKQYARYGFLDIDTGIDLLHIPLEPYRANEIAHGAFAQGDGFYCNYNYFISGNKLTPTLILYITQQVTLYEAKKIYVVTDFNQYDIVDDHITLIENKSVEQELAQLKVNTFIPELHQYIVSLNSEKITNADILFFKKHIFFLNMEKLKILNTLYNNQRYCNKVGLLTNITYIMEGFLKYEYAQLLKHFQLLKKYEDNFLHDFQKIKTINKRYLKSTEIRYLINNQDKVRQNISTPNLQYEIYSLQYSLHTINHLKKFEDIEEAYRLLLEKTKKHVTLSEEIVSLYSMFISRQPNCLCNLSARAKKDCRLTFDDQISYKVYTRSLSQADQARLEQCMAKLENKNDFYLMDCVRCHMLLFDL